MDARRASQDTSDATSESLSGDYTPPSPLWITNCLQTGSDCIYPFPENALPSNDAGLSGSGLGSGSGSSSAVVTRTQGDAVASLNNALNDYVGGSFDALTESSKRLLRHFTQFTVWGESPVSRASESSVIQKSFENPGYMHMCLMLSACQWAWVKGSLDEVRIPFLYHKAATYQFARELLQSPETAQSGDTMLAISALALTEGAIGELDASSRHLRGIRSATESWSSTNQTPPTLPQRMLKLIGDGLRTGKSEKLVNVPEYQPTFMALLFASIWDITALPPREAPSYGWWDDQETQAARIWQNHTKDLKLNYDIGHARGAGKNACIPEILNGDPRSSRTSFIATFFYLYSELGHVYFDVTLVDWLLEQLIDDVNSGEEYLRTSTWTQSLWLWCVMFGAAIASCGRARSAVEERQLYKWQGVYNDKMRLVSRVLGIDSWSAARAVLTRAFGSMDEEVEGGLSVLWAEAVDREGGGISGEASGSSQVTELLDQD